jgi:hercynylcysteine S-oxide lyase
MVVFVNLTGVAESVWGRVIDYWVEWHCDAWVKDLKKRKPDVWLSLDTERLSIGRRDGSDESGESRLPSIASGTVAKKRRAPASK